MMVEKGIAMPRIIITGSGRIDDSDSAFPQAVQLASGDILCSFSVGGGPNAEGFTNLARSRDGGTHWDNLGPILAATREPWSTNCLRISKAHGSDALYAYGARSYRSAGGKFGEGMNEAVFCRSEDGGITWSQPRVVTIGEKCPLEISFAAIPLQSGRLLAPAAVLPSKDRLGERVLAAVSDDGGKTWPKVVTVFQDPQKRFGFFEHKFCEFAPGQVMAVCWTVTLGDVRDQPDSFAISRAGGLTWGPACSTGIMGQTMTPVHLGGDRLLVLYNRRYGQQGVVMALVTFDENSWQVHFEDMMYDARSQRSRPDKIKTGVDEFDSFAFGFPTAIRLKDGSYLATHWCRENGRFGIRWTKLKVDW